MESDVRGARGLRAKSRYLLLLGIAALLSWNLIFRQVGEVEKITADLMQGRYASSEQVAISRSSSTVLPGARSDEAGGSTAHILFALCGDHPGFLGEFEVALKSVLLNAPLDYELSVHVVADHAAYTALGEIFHRTKLVHWNMRNQVTIAAYNVQSRVKDWEKRILKLWDATGLHGKHYDPGGHTIGTWFRLFAYEVLPSSVDNVVYMDTDVVFMTNVADLWRLIEPQYLFYMGRLGCAGFMPLSMKQMPLLWEKAASIDLYNITKASNYRPTDQLVFKAINITYPSLAGVLPDEYDLNVAAGLWRQRRHPIRKRSKIGMFHFNGGGDSKESYFKTHKIFKDPKLAGTFDLALYYANAPWDWVRYWCESKARDGKGQPLALQYTSTDEPATTS